MKARSSVEEMNVDELKDLLAQLVYDQDRLRTIPDTAKYMSATPGAVRALIKRGELRSVQIGNADFVAQSAIHSWIEKSHKAQENERYRRELATARKGSDPSKLGSEG